MFAIFHRPPSFRIATQSLKGKEIRWKPSPMLSVVQVSYDCDNMVSVRIRCKDFFRLVICLLTFAFLLPFSVHSAELAMEKISVAYASISRSEERRVGKERS